MPDEPLPLCGLKWTAARSDDKPEHIHVHHLCVLTEGHDWMHQCRCGAEINNQE